jgi:hypothetical protein
MSRFTLPTTVLALALLATACADQNSPMAPSGIPLSNASGKPRGGGFDNANNVGSITGTQWGPSPWIFTPEVEAQGTICWDQGLCAVGNIYNPDFLPAGVLDLGVNSNPDPNPPDNCVDPGNVPSTRCFALLSTTNFLKDTSDNGITDLVEIHTLRSGLQTPTPTPFSLDPNTGWVFKLDYGFMSSSPPAGSTNAFAAVYLDYDSDANGTFDATVTALQLTRTQLEQGTVPLKAGGCGTDGLGGIASSYPLCTGWQSLSFDATFLAGKAVQVRIVVDEGGTDPGVATSLAIDNIRFEETVLAGALTATPNPVQTGSPVSLSGTFTDPEIGIVHTATISWGDGSTSAGVIVEPSGATPGSVSGSHSYANPGTYTIGVAISDGSGTPGSSSTTVTVVAAPPAVRLDILPGLSNNKIYLHFNLPIPVALFGSATFDVRKVPVSSLRFGPAGARAILGKAILVDLNHDGFLDQLTSYLTRQTGIQPGSTRACLSGTNNGVAFQACDAITTVGVP